jgi:alcohol dehydrogenase class IV
MNFEFATAGRIVFGAGRLREIGPQAKTNTKRALVVTGRNAARAEPLLAILRKNGVEAVTFSVTGEPEISTVEKGTAFAREEKCDTVFGFGGGSVIDTGKAIAAMMKNDGEVLDYLEIIGRGKTLSKYPATFIAIPTTAGTGSEVTRNSVLGSPGHKLKVSLRSPMMLPKVALVDPELTYDLPPSLTASTGLDALTQVIEPYVCTRANPMTDGFCAEGMRRAARSLRTAYSEGQNKSAREDMAVTGLLGGLALANAGLGAVHGFAGPIGGSFPAPHGEICAALLPHVMAANIRALRERDVHNLVLGRYYQVAHLLTGNPSTTADAGVDWVRELVKELGIAPLRTFGIRQEHIPDLVAKAQNASSMKANPIVLTPDELAEILRQAI